MSAYQQKIILEKEEKKKAKAFNMGRAQALQCPVAALLSGLRKNLGILFGVKQHVRKWQKTALEKK